jgi:hypothetical protein
MSILNACALYGPSTYVNNWLPASLVVILISLAAIALVYILNQFLPRTTSSKLTGMLKSEMIITVVSIVIIIILVAASGIACQITSGLSSPGQDPITFAEGYLVSLVGNGGIGLLTNLYAQHFATAVVAGIWSRFADFIGAWLPTAAQVGSTLSVSFPLGYDLSIAYGILSGIYIDVMAPIVMVAAALIYIQYLLLVLVQASAFTIILPVALIMRVLPFGGANLRNAANGVLALAIAGYIVFPLTIAFDSYAINWTFTQCTTGAVPGTCNPSAVYADSLLCVSGTAGTVSACHIGPIVSAGQMEVPGLSQTFFGISTPDPGQVFSGGVSSDLLKTLYPQSAVDDMDGAIGQTAVFMFVAFMMSTLDFAITLSFAMNLAKVLSSGIEGAGSFWSGL